MAKGIAHREWAIHRSDYDTDQDFRAAVEQEMALNVHIMERLGVAVVAGPARKRWPGGGFYTERVIFQTATVPAARDDEPVTPEPYEDDAEELAAVGFTDDE